MALKKDTNPLAYLKNKPKTIRWKVTHPEGARLSPLQTYDIIFDERDLKIRKLI